MIPKGQCYVKRSDVVTRRIAGETIIVPVTTNVAQMDSIYTLNDIGTFIWERLDGQTSLENVTEAITAGYDVQTKEAALAVQEFVDLLAEAELLYPPSEVEA